MGSDRSTFAILMQIITDVLIYLAVNAGLVVLYGFFSPPHRGFRCDDISIRFPRRPETVPIIYLMIVAFSAPVLAILLLEGFWKLLKPRRKDGRFVEFLSSTGKLLAMFLYGISLAMVITEVIKVATGALRPHFLDTCKPKPYNCTPEGYVYSVECSNEDLQPWELNDARKGFPSGHAAVAAYSATFLCMYLEFRLIIPFSVLLKSLIQAGMCGLALFCAASRIRDNRHHIQDVVVGLFIGSALAVWSVFCLSKHMRRERCITQDYGGEHAALLDSKFVARPGEEANV